MFTKIRQMISNLIYGVEPQPSVRTETTIAQVVEIDLDNAEITVHEPSVARIPPAGFTYATNESSELLKRGTKLKESGDINSAIESVRRAYKQAAAEGVEHGVKTYLKLPMYLQKAGRADEGWRELNLLLAKCSIMEQSDVYDKMRLFLQRERKPKDAIRYGVFAYVVWAIGLHQQKRRSELRGYFSRSSIESVVLPLLKKAKLLDRTDQMIETIAAESATLPDVDLGSLGRKIDNIVFIVDIK